MLDKFFEPRSVAVIGASREAGKIGNDVLRNLIQYGYKGKLYPINPKSDEIMELPCYKSVKDVPGEVDLAVICIPAKFALEAVRDCAAKKVPAVVIITAGFKEMGREGAELERQVVEVAASSGMRIVGPNCLGVINTATSLNASFAAGMPERGDIAFLSQSGAFGTAVLDWAIGEKIGFSKFVSVGNKADVDETSLLEAIGGDQDTKVLLGYIESVQHGPEFMKIARAVTRRKPVVLFKSGNTAAGAKAASSHTGALAGSDKAYVAAFSQTGILRAEQVVDMFDWGLAFSYQHGIKGPNVALVTNAGGPGIIATDAIEKSRLKMATLTKETVEDLRKKLPPAANFYNPIDVLGDAKADRYDFAIRAALKDPNVDGVIVVLTPQTSTEPLPTAEALVKAAGEFGKPVVAAFMGGPASAEGFRYLMRNRVPCFPFPERAVSAMNALYRQRLWLDTPEGESPVFNVNRDAVTKIFKQLRDAGRTQLGEIEAREVISAYGFRLPKSVLAPTAQDAVKAAEGIGFPVVMKISSPDILHKSDVGGVKVGLKSAAEVENAFNGMMETVRKRMPKADIHGVLVQQMAGGGKEVILGMTRDPQFGPMLMFGLGGIYVEVLKDVSFRVAPITRADAEAMVNEIRAIALLKGVRGQAPADLDAVIEGILRLAQLCLDFPEIVEIDVNPLLAFPRGEGAMAIDARIVLKS